MEREIKTKKCSKCNEDKLFEHFHKSKGGKYGLKSFCKTCRTSKELLPKGKKRCSNCKELKTYLEFQKRTLSSDGYRGTCKKCYNESYNKYVKSLDIPSEIDIKICSKCSIEKPINEFYKDGRKKSGYYSSCKSCKYEMKLMWNKNNPHILSWRTILKSSLKRLGKKKEGNTIDLLGYSALDLKNYMMTLFTDGMSWDNYGEWHIDHIKPVSSFDSETPPSVVNKLSNLQPLWATTREINGVIYKGNLNKGIY